MTVYPDYYPRFRCIASACKHNCCIGWEIDIDDDTLTLYRQLNTPLGDRLRAHIDPRPAPHFVLGAGERCPFLNEQNLCDIIAEMGEEALCDICYLHPRFHNERENYTEVGLGLSCEAAAALILGQKEPVVLCRDDGGVPPGAGERDRLISALQDRSRPLAQRLPFLTLQETKEWIDLFLSLERLDEQWTQRLTAAKTVTEEQLERLDKQMKERQTEYEQLSVYLLYRHYSNDPRSKKLPLLICSLLRLLAASILTEKGDFTFADQVELARAFSAEIEYSDENMDILLSNL